MTDPGVPTARDLVTYRLNLLANLLSKQAGSIYGRRFELTIGEWRVIAVLHDAGQLSLTALAAATNLDKGQASRVVSTLLDRGVVLRAADERDGRGVALSLSEDGCRLFDEVYPVARERHERVLATLSSDDRANLDRILGQLTDEARRMWREEKEGAERVRSKP